MCRFLLMAFITAACLNCNSPTSNTIANTPVVGSNEFYVTGKVSNNGAPVKGALVRLIKSGLKTVTKDDGTYLISGQSGVLAKSEASAGGAVTDTLVIKVANSSQATDSSEVQKAVVTAGVVENLPSTYIVQREIRGDLVDLQNATIGTIKGYVFDNAAPDQIKTINLWYDQTNSAFSSFAYFSSETSKNYTIYVKVFDQDHRIIGQTADLTFPDNAGNIIFKSPLSVINAKPVITITAPVSVSPNVSVNVIVTATDSFGQLLSCQYSVNESPFANTNQAERDPASSRTDTITITSNDTDAVMTVSIKVIDNDSNITVSNKAISVKKPKIFVTLEVVSAATNEEAIFFSGDSAKMIVKTFSCDDPTLTRTKTEWQVDTTKWLPVDSTITISYDPSNLINYFKNSAPRDYRLPVNGQDCHYLVQDVYPRIKITMSNGYEYITGRGIDLYLETISCTPMQ